MSLHARTLHDTEVSIDGKTLTVPAGTEITIPNEIRGAAPQAPTEPAPEVATPTVAPIRFKISSESRNYYAEPEGGARFFVGQKVRYGSYWGLYNESGTSGTRYSADNYRGQHGFWADFIYPTAQCESKGRFHCLNTYDRAQFTFGFLQFAAHVPNGDFVRFLLRLLATPAARQYYPDLRAEDGKIVRDTDRGPEILASAETTKPLMNWLNPGLTEVEEIEVIHAAKFVHWALNDPGHRDIQVACGIQFFKDGMVQYSKRYGLNGMDDRVCLIIADIRHQGRAKSSEIMDALHTNGDQQKAIENLLAIGHTAYADRIRTLRSTIETLTTDGVLGKRKYDQGQGAFV